MTAMLFSKGVHEDIMFFRAPVRTDDLVLSADSGAYLLMDRASGVCSYCHSPTAHRLRLLEFHSLGHQKNHSGNMIKNTVRHPMSRQCAAVEEETLPHTFLDSSVGFKTILPIPASFQSVKQNLFRNLRFTFIGVCKTTPGRGVVEGFCTNSTEVRESLNPTHLVAEWKKRRSEPSDRDKRRMALRWISHGAPRPSNPLLKRNRRFL